MDHATDKQANVRSAATYLIETEPFDFAVPGEAAQEVEQVLGGVTELRDVFAEYDYQIGAGLLR